MRESNYSSVELQEVIIPETGEMARVRVTTQGGRYAMSGGGYGVVSCVYISRMLEMKLGAGLEVALHLMSKCDYGGLCMEKNADIAKALGMSKTRVSTRINELHRKGVLHRVGPRTVFMNPAFFFRGSAKEQYKALDRWAVYRRELMQQPKAA